jgi:hypothetical protein
MNNGNLVRGQGRSHIPWRHGPPGVKLPLHEPDMVGITHQLQLHFYFLLLLFYVNYKYYNKKLRFVLAFEKSKERMTHG